MVRGLPLEDRLDDGSNYGSWKPGVLLALEEYDMKDFALKDVLMPKEEDQQATWRRHDVKARKNLMDSVKSHLVFHIFKVETTKDMFDILKNLFERDSTCRSIALRIRCHTSKMKRSESVDSYFARVAKIKEQLGNVGEVIPNKEFSTYMLRGLPNAWESFVQSVSRHDQLHKYDRLWADCVEEEARLAAKHGGHHDDNQALAARWKGKKEKYFSHKSQGRRSDHKYDRRSDNKNQDGRLNDKRGQPSRIQCYGFQGYGHIKKDCPSVNKNHHPDRRQRQRASKEETEEPSSKKSRRAHSKDSYYLLLSALSGTIQTSRDIWLIDSGASRHMTGYRELLSDLSKREN